VDKYHHGNLRAALLKSAFKLVGKIGMEGFTLREVARLAGVSHNAPYRHFKSKEDLMAALAAEGFHQLHDAIEKAVAEVNGRIERLRAGSRAYLHFALQSPPRFDVMFHSAFDREAYPEYISAYTQVWELGAALVRGEEAPSAALETGAEIVWAQVHGITELGLSGRLRSGSKEELEQLVDVGVGVLLRGFTG
jgi:AcrR family transcriptional regulator